MPSLIYNTLAVNHPPTGVATIATEIHRALREHAPQLLARTIAPAPRLPRVLRIVAEQLLLPPTLLTRRNTILFCPAYVAPLLSPRPTWLLIHDLHVWTHPQTCTRANRLHYKLLIPPSLRRAEKIFVLSQHTRDILTHHFPNTANKTHILPIGIPHDLKPVPNTPLPFDLPPNFFLFVGGLHPRKNLTRLIHAFLRLPDDARLVIAGPQAGDAANILPLISQHAHRIHYLGYVPTRQLAALYSRARALVFPSLDEGLGLPVLEAIACHCPVIATDGPARELFPHALLCDPLSVDSIANAMTCLWHDTPLCHELSQRAAERAKEFSWRHTAHALEALL